MRYQNTFSDLQEKKVKSDHTDLKWAMAYMVVGSLFFIASLAFMGN